MSDSLVQPNRGRLTFDAEGQEGGPFHSRHLHVPSSASGLTIGRGYDMKRRSKSDVRDDLADAADSEGMCREIDAMGQLDVLVNNMGIFNPKPFAEIEDSEWQTFFDANIMSTVRLSRHFFPQMLQRDFGRIFPSEDVTVDEVIVSMNAVLAEDPVLQRYVIV